MNTDGTGFYTCKECHETESLWNSTTTDHKEGEQLEDRRSVGASSCNSGDGTDQRVQSLMFMMMTKRWFEVSTEWLLRNQIFWVVAPSFWVTLSDVSKKHVAFIFSVKGQLLTLKTKVILSVEGAGINCATTRINTSEDLIPQYENSVQTNTTSQRCVISSE